MIDEVFEMSELPALPEPIETVPWWQLPGVLPPVVCNVHRGTGEFLCTSYADPSPLEPGVWLIPAFGYEIDPPAVDAGYVALIGRDENSWTIVADHRGATVYSTVTGQARVWLALGDLPEGYTLEAPTSEFDVWDQDQWVLDEAAQSETVRLAAYRKQGLATQYATARITVLQDAVDLNMARDDEPAKLEAWKRYRVELNQLDIAAHAPDDDDWPSSPNDEALAAWLASQTE